MDAIELLIQQHRQVADLFDDLAEAENDDETQDVFDEIADALAIHSMLEEQIFYPATRAARTDDTVREAIEEHQSMKRAIADLLDLAPSDAQFTARCKALRELVEHHVEEEEEELMPGVRKLLGKAQLEEMAQEMESMAEDLRQQGAPRHELLALNDTTAPI